MTKTPGPTTNNRRLFDRLPFESNVQLFSGSAVWTCQILDISLKGILFSRPSEWGGNIHEFYRLSMSQENSPSISMSIEIVHITDESIGAMWNKIDMGSFSQLKRTLELNTLKKNRITKQMSFL